MKYSEVSRSRVPGNDENTAFADWEPHIQIAHIGMAIQRWHSRQLAPVDPNFRPLLSKPDNSTFEVIANSIFNHFADSVCTVRSADRIYLGINRNRSNVANY